MRRSLYCIGILGMLATLVSTGTTTAAAVSCEPDFEERLNCWFRWIGEGTFVVTLNDALPFDGDQRARRSVERKVVTTSRSHLIVEVPANQHTGPGGTALLLLAGVRWVEASAHIDRLSPEAVQDLKAVGACDTKNRDDLCARLATQSLRGSDLIKADPRSDRSQHAYSVTAAADPATSAPSRVQNSSDQAKDTKSTGPLFDKKTMALTALCALLLLLLTTFLVLVRRSSRSPATAAPHLAEPAAASAAPAPRPRASDEPTTRLRAAPAPRHGREAGDGKEPVRTAVVRTELHPQGYVELDHVLYRAVWADPGRPPPVPGGLVDVTDARDGDSDVLYAFPAAAGRHDQHTRP
ncbi:Vmc-like lipoprotein signal peptide domain-containing protein [Streptomyces mirabilis]